MAATSGALLLVDGYNIIGAWSYLKRTRERDGLEAARRELVEALVNYTAHEGWLTKIVFDSHYQKTPGSQEDYTPSLSVYYTAFAQTADTYIEKVCASFKHQDSSSISRLIVATSDRAQRLTAIGYGAEWMSAQRLASEVELVSCRIRAKHRPKKQTQGRFLFNCLDPQAQQRLSQWRRGIY
ncbi:MAG: NYN domain-containing protein [Hydrococcus sp. C42_A2020_068]|uniref:NYN domain-containing protein n=1 Tax=Pleurocapsa sp. PCC 7327 TaxID=118163 RepID=UPI00029F8587|nr:NYN domain-containing protein [Pleurocapsa sp. PCC 7327]AFY76035.1 putative RNA-binding protein containing a PIN domain [Pleurocapsa sp. PCC 7327]MBF2021902.1 NYN domain-containing protein [Hydrococcus sp. C42_A2020_068]